MLQCFQEHAAGIAQLELDGHDEQRLVYCEIRNRW